MVIRTLKMMVSLVTSGTVILPSVAQEAASNKIEGNPNILLIMVDDLGLGDLSCQYAKDVQTPNISSRRSYGQLLCKFIRIFSK